MDMNISPEHLDTVCEGCLSLERHLTAVVSDQHIKKLYYEILNITIQDVEGVTLRLCLECKANILKYYAFKTQVEEAHEILSKVLLKSSQSTSSLRSPARLATFALKREGEHSGTLPHVPLAFIKVEDVDDGSDGGGGRDDFVDDGSSRDGEAKDFTAVLNTDLTAPNTLTLNSIHTDKTSIYKDEDFDASDEEPLNKKKREREGASKNKPRKRKKRDDGSPKIDRRKHPLPKREKPAGVVDNQRVRNKLQQLNVAAGQLEMRVLSWDEVEAERQKALLSVTFTRHQYRCNTCVLGFNHKFKLNNHMKKHDPSAGACQCGVCAVRCRNQRSLAAHRRRHRVRWRCVACGACSSRADVAADHVAREHNAALPTHTCRQCGHTAPSLAKLRNHMKNHRERQNCELCGKSFRDRSSLRTHLFIHAGCKEYVCPRCDKRFLFKKAMEVHLVTHDAHAHLYCYECDLNFKNRMSFNQHMKYSLKHIDPAKLKYACSSCDKKFVKASRLQEHTLAVHLKATPVSCAMPDCNFACSSRPVLRTHMRMVHRNGRAVRNHVCDACGKAYMSKKTLEGHLRSHTGERPFKCSHCSATFGYSAALYNHNKLVHAKVGRLPAAPAPSSPVDASRTT